MTSSKIKSLLAEKIIVEGLSHKESITLLYVVKNNERNEETNVKTLQDIFKIKVSSTVQLLNKLEEKELIIRKSSDKDKRISVVVSTEKGKKIIKSLLCQGEELLISAADNLEELNNALDVLARFSESLSKKEATIINLKEDVYE